MGVLPCMKLVSIFFFMQIGLRKGSHSFAEACAVVIRRKWNPKGHIGDTVSSSDSVLLLISDAAQNIALHVFFGETSVEAKTRGKVSSESDLSIQLDLMPFSPVPRSQTSFDKLQLPWLNENLVGEPGNVNQRIRGVEEAEEAIAF
ncbi:unnamed protein product [Fraxinus pennsylvanica]|uniref:Uncharacterized protein n=1 Tax=Fraxinus pennsylvanica TaxID=56036 RepID=A0AAD2AIW8_9LAMI|nr:unnamed protein product [Fraxinus pennsylvanica]